MDEDTLQVMNLPRCGVKDKVGFGTDARRKRYALQGKLLVPLPPSPLTLLTLCDLVESNDGMRVSD